MLGEFLAALLGTLGGAGLTIAAVRMLSGKFLELQVGKALATHQHGLNESITRLQTELGRVSDVLSRRNEREFAVVEQAWDLMISAFRAAESRLSGIRLVPAFARMDEPDAERTIQALPFGQRERNALLAASRETRDELYGQFDSAHSVQVGWEAWGEFNDCLISRQIFISASIYDDLMAIATELTKIFSLAHAYASHNQAIPTTEIPAVQQTLRAIKARIDALAVTIRKRFGFEDTDRGST